MAVVLDGKVKPKLSGIDPDLVAPEWQWFWEAANFVVPIWEGGGDVHDIARNAQAQQLVGTFGGNAAWDLSPLGPNLDFGAGASDLVTFGNVIDLHNSTEIAVEVLCRVDLDGQNQALFSNGPIAQNVTARWVMWWDDVGGITGRLNNITFFVVNSAGTDSSRVESSQNVVDDGGWHHVIGQWRASPQRVELWVDGALDQADSDLGTVTALSTASQALQIGAAAGASELDGGIALAVLYNRTLTPAEIRQRALDPFGPFRMLDDVALFSGAAGAFIELDAVIAATSSIAPTLSVARDLAALIAATSSVTPVLAAVKLLDTSITALSSVSAALDAQPGISSFIAAVSSITSELDAQPGLSSDIAAISALASSLDAQSGLYSAIAAVSVIAAELDPQTGGIIILDSVIAAVSALSASLDAQPGLYSSITATSAVSTSIDSQSGLNSVIAAVAAVSGEVNIVVNIDGTILSSSTVTGGVSLLRSLDSLISGTSTVGGELSRLAGLTVIIPGVSTIIGEITGEAPEARGFIFPANAAQSHAIVDNAAQSHILVNNQFPNP